MLLSHVRLQVEWTTAKNPGGVLHSRLHRAVEIERVRALRELKAAKAQAKRARSASPGGPAAKRADGKSDRAASADGRRGRSRSRERKERDRERGKGRESEDRKDRDRARERDRERDRERERDRMATARLMREPDLKSRRWDEVVRSTTRGVIAKLPRPFIEDARRVLYNTGEGSRRWLPMQPMALAWKYSC